MAATQSPPSLPSTSAQIRTKLARLQALRLANQQLSKKLNTIDKQLAEVDIDSSSKLQKAREMNAAAKADLVLARQTLDSKELYADALRRFVERIGLTVGLSVEGDSRKTLCFSGLWEHGEDCVIYLSKYKLPAFEAVDTDPPLRNFQDIADEANESNNFVYLIVKCREQFLQYIEKRSIGKSNS